MAGNGVEMIFNGSASSSRHANIHSDFETLLVQNQRVPCSSQPFETFFVPGSSSSSFLGSSSMVSFKDVCGGKRSERSSFFRPYDQEENGDEDFDDYFHQPEKKRRLTVEQVQFLEKSFETENKLEPERKIQLAKDLGLQPRQVAIWFQNRRARWKTKQLEKDFDTLQASYNSLKGDYDNLLKEKEKLQAEVAYLTDKLCLKEKEQGDNSEPSNTYDQSKTGQQEPVIDSASEVEDHQVSVLASSKQDELSSAKSDVLDSESPHYVEGDQSSFGDASYAFEADHSDISQDDEEDYLNKTIMPSSHHVFPKIEDVNYSDDPSVNNSCNFGLPNEDHTSLFWPYWDINLKM